MEDWISDMTEQNAEYAEAQTDQKPIAVTFNLEPENYAFIRQWAAEERRTYSAQMNILLDQIRNDMEAEGTGNAS